MESNHQEIVKEEYQETPIIQTIEIKPEPQAEPELIIKTIDIEPKESQQESDQSTIQPIVRVSKKTILEKCYESEHTSAKVINITEISSLAAQPKTSRVRKFSKKFKADNFNCKGIGIVIDSSNVIYGAEVDAGSFNNIEHIKAEKELIIEDTLPEDGICSSGAVIIQDFQNSELELIGDRNIKKKAKRLKIDDQKNHLNDAKNVQYTRRHQKNNKTKSDDPEAPHTDSKYSIESTSSSQTEDNNNYEIKPENSSTSIKQQDEYNDPESSTDSTYENHPTSSNDSSSDTPNTNYTLQDGKYTCNTCNMQFKLLKNFTKHDCIICQYCKKVFTTRCALKRHILHIHTQTDEIFECKDCNKIFKAKKYLETHIKSHEKIHECENCGKKFGNTSRLNEHRIKHKNPEVLTCKLCDRKCASRSSLKFHMRIHDVDRQKNLKCDKCSFSTDDNRTLVKHQKSHVKQEERFKMSTEWLKCEKCQARLKNKQSLNNHMYYVHSELSFQCNMCGIVVKTERNLRRHWKNIHEHENKS